MNELTVRNQEPQNEVNCIKDSRVFKDAESVRSGLSHVPCQHVLFPPFRDPGEVCTFSQFPTAAMQWIKEVELVDIYSWYFNAEF